MYIMLLYAFACIIDKLIIYIYLYSIICLLSEISDIHTLFIFAVFCQTNENYNNLL